MTTASPATILRRIDAWRILAGAILAAWALSIALPCLRVAHAPEAHSVYPVYVLAGRGWAAGQNIYLGTGYRYSPVVAAFFSLFSHLPDCLGAPLWHLLNAGVYVVGLAAWLRRGAPAAVQRAPAMFFLLVLLPSLASLNNGQANALVMGLLLLALAAVHDERWNTAATCIVMAGAFKVYPWLLGAMLVALYPRRLMLRLPLLILVTLALPFLLQAPGYVLHEYQSWFQHLRGDDRQVLPLPLAYRDLRLLLRVSGVPIERFAYMCLQLTAAGTLVLLLFARRRRLLAGTNLLPRVLALSTLGMTVLGPSTEACTYLFLAPSLAHLLISTGSEDRHGLRKAALAMAYFLVTYPQIPLRLPGAGTLGNHGAQCVGGLICAIIVVAMMFDWRLRPCPSRPLSGG